MRLHHFVAGHQGAHTEFVDRELDLGNRLLRRVHGDDGGGGHFVRDVFVHVGIHHIQCPACALAQLVVRHDLGAESRRAVKGGEIHPGLFQTPGTELRQHHGGPVETQGAGREAPRHAFGVIRRAFGGRGLLVALDQRGATHLLQEVGQDELRFDHVAVSIDDREVEGLA